MPDILVISPQRALVSMMSDEDHESNSARLPATGAGYCPPVQVPPWAFVATPLSPHSAQIFLSPLLYLYIECCMALVWQHSKQNTKPTSYFCHSRMHIVLRNRSRQLLMVSQGIGGRRLVGSQPCKRSRERGQEQMLLRWHTMRSRVVKPRALRYCFPSCLPSSSKT